MCAFDHKAVKGEQVDACQGDFGGPLVCPLSENYLHPSVKKLNENFKNNRNNKNHARKMVQVGIVSSGGAAFTCGLDNPAIYTKVSMFKKWMTKTIMKHSPAGVATTFQLIDAKGQVKPAKVENGIKVKVVAKLKKKYCLIGRNSRRKGAMSRLISGTKCEISDERKHYFKVYKTGRMDAGWVLKSDCKGGVLFE